MKKTLYQILDVDPKASAQEIEAAHARLAQKTDWADDNMPGLLRQAREILFDAARRDAYDASLAAAQVDVGARDWNPEPGSRGTWSRWIAALVVVAGLAIWWLSRHDAALQPNAVPAVAGAPKIAPATAAAPAPAAVDAPAEEEAAPEETPPAAPPLPATPAPASASPVTPTPAAPAASPSARSAETVFAGAAPSIARINVMDASDRLIGTGSGVVIDDGVMLTSCHVALLGTKLAVKLADAVMPATVILADEAFDLCRLGVAAMHAPAVAIGSVGSLRTGQRVYAIGAPAGLELTISEGIVSALRKVDEGTVIQTTAPISPGSSGGGLFDDAGRLVGIMTFQHRFGQNLNFALPADWIGQMRERKASEPGWRTASVADRSQALPPNAMIIGRWLCRDWTSGKTMHYTFEIDGRLGISTTDSEAASLKYGVSGKTLQIADAKQAMTLAIDELTARKMILHGRDKSVACERQ